MPSNNFFKNKGFSNSNDQIGSNSDPVKLSDSVKTLPRGIVYRSNCETSLKNVLDVLSLIESHLLIDAYVDVEAIYSTTGNLSITIAASGDVTVPGLSATSIDSGTVTTTSLAGTSGSDLTISCDSDKRIIFDDGQTESCDGIVHEFGYSARSTTLLVQTSTNTGGVWSSAVTISAAPSGATAAYCNVLVNVAGLGLVCVEKASGVTLDDITSSFNFRKYRFVRGDSVVKGDMIWIPIDSNKQFKWCTYTTNSTVEITSPVEYRR